MGRQWLGEVGVGRADGTPEGSAGRNEARQPHDALGNDGVAPVGPSSGLKWPLPRRQKCGGFNNDGG